MEKLKLTNMVLSEIESSQFDNKQKSRIKEFLVNPYKSAVFYDMTKKDIIKLWIVYEELDDDSSGYKIFYNEEQNDYGLVTSSVGTDYLVGYYGTFIETWKSI